MESANNKHAYLIIAHSDPEVFASLLSTIDHARNDIYIHIDKRTDIRPYMTVRCNFSKVFFLEERLACKWGSLNTVKTEFALLKQASSNRSYAYYHLLSGVDLPIKTQDEIHRFFDEKPNMNFIGFFNKANADSFNTRFYHLLVKRPGGDWWNKSCIYMNLFLIWLQGLIKVNRHYPFPIYKGAQWFSISDPFCSYLLSREKEVTKAFRMTRCPDERFVQSVIMDSPYTNSLYGINESEYNQCLREIDWEKGSPYTWTCNDFEHLKASKRLFARKFSSSDMGIVRRVSQELAGGK